MSENDRRPQRPVDALLDAQDIAIELKIPERTLTQWRWSGVGPRYLKVGRHVRYRRSDVDAWLEGQTRDPAERVG